MAELDATYEGILTAKAMGMDLASALNGDEESLRNAFKRLVERCQTSHGFFVNSPILREYPPELLKSEVESNFYAVSILNLSNATELLEKGSFRWPPDAKTFLESTGINSYYILLGIIILVILEVILIVCKDKKTAKTKQMLLHSRTEMLMLNLL